MLQTKKLLALAVVLAALISVATIAYENYIQDEIYQESADHLLETYGQVAKTFTLFAQRSWNVLSDWDSELQSIAEEKDVAALGRSWSSERISGNTATSTCSTRTASS